MTLSLPRRSIGPVLRPLPWCLTAFALALGCGGCKPKPQPHESAPPSSASAPAEDEPPPLQPISAPPTDPATDLQGLGEEARRARVKAQRALLGQALFEDATGETVPWISPQTTAVAASEVEALDDAVLDSLPGSSGLGPAGATGGRRINGNALGEYQPLIVATADAKPLARFYDALRRLEAGTEPDGKVRVLMYGASHTDADVYTHYVRAYLRERFGDGGHGFVHVAKPWKWYGHVEMLTEGFDKWRTEHAQRRKGRGDGYYGLMGASLSATNKKAWGRVTHRDGSVGSHYELYFLTQPKGGSFSVSVDGKPHAKVSTRGEVFAPGYHAIDLPEGQHSIEVRPVGNGEVRLFGMTTERDTPGVVVDTLGIGGTRASNMLSWAPEIWYDNVRRRDPELIVLAYGTNEANSGISRKRYEVRLRDVLTRLREAAPGADCVLVGPGDFPERGPDGVYQPRASTSFILEAQREISLEMGCGFWDLRAFMGGEMAMVKWAAATPAMAKGDHIHLTRRGYVRMGMGLVDAMMAGFDADVLGRSTISRASQ